MTFAAKLAEAALGETRDGLPAATRESGIVAITRTCSAAMSRKDQVLVEALLPTDATSPPTTTAQDAFAEAAAVGASAHRALGCDGASPTPCACAVVAAALATSRRHDVPGSTLIGATVWGTEVQLRLAAAMSPTHESEGWQPIGTVGPIGAAVAASLVIGSTVEQLAHAVGIATSLSLGHGVLTGPAAAIHAGKAAANGVLAAHLARSDFSASATAVEGPRGFFAVIAPSADPALVLAGLGERWLITEHPPAHSPTTPSALDTHISGLTSASSVHPLLDVLRGKAA